MFKSFKPPSFVRKSTQETDDAISEPAPKRLKTVHAEDSQIRLSAATSERNATRKPTQSTVALRTSPRRSPKRPLEVNRNSQNTQKNIKTGFNKVPAGHDEFYSVLWRKPTAKKNKTWDGDAVLRVRGEFAYLREVNGKSLGKANCRGPLLPGSQLKIGGRELEVDSLISREDYFGDGIGQVDEIGEAGDVPRDPIVIGSSPLPSSAKTVSESTQVRSRQSPPKKASEYKKPRARAMPSASTSASTQQQQQQYNPLAQWKNPVKDNTVLTPNDEEPTPRHDATALDALVMRRLPLSEVPKGKQVVDVVVDPLLARKLRPHQREGVKFLYDCVMGMKSKLGQGAILADDMGLGKTLQTIALIWTLLKQNPIYGDEPVIRKALIVCPVTLIRNWKKEFRKWLGIDRIGVFVADDKRTRITDFTRGKSYNVMIIGYDRLRSVYEELQKGQRIDLIVADEGHRLKTAQSKSAQAIQSLDTPRRIILSGTPIQNNLGEFFSMVDFVNPGALGTLKAFTKNFEMPIERSRQPGALDMDVEKGEATSEELAEITNSFILRRTAQVLAQYLPPKTESILLCRPTKSQAEVYRHVLASPVFQSALGSAENALQLITILKKVCNSPQLLAAEATADPDKATLAPAVASQIPPRLLRHASTSSKLQVLDQLLYNIQNHTDEKVVIVSNFTSTLDVLANLLSSLSMPHLRLDGSTPPSKRQDLVDTFNRTDRTSCFAFLLSAKAGGMGINLIGASRLILFDVDWNPAIDAQAMARIHRDGQKRPCYIYRLLLAGALDEKIWQRQVTKLNLASSVLDSKAGQASFTKEELRDLFRLDEGMSCQTHDLIACDCGGSKPEAAKQAPRTELAGHSADASHVDDDNDDSEEGLVQPGKTRAQEDDSGSDLDLLPPMRRKRQPKAKKGTSPDLPLVIKASEIDMEAQELEITRSRERARQDPHGGSMHLDSLMAYAHVDAQNLAARAGREHAVEDDVLQKVISDEDNLVNFVFLRTMG